jgi:hypothetical protein
VVGVGVGFEDAFDPYAFLLCDSEVLLDRERGIHDHRDTCLRIADQVRRAPEVLVHELPKEQHGS